MFQDRPAQTGANLAPTCRRRPIGPIPRPWRLTRLSWSQPDTQCMAGLDRHIGGYNGPRLDHGRGRLVRNAGTCGSERVIWRERARTRQSDVHMTRRKGSTNSTPSHMTSDTSGRGMCSEGHRRKWVMQRGKRLATAGNGRLGHVEVAVGGRARGRRG